MDEKSKTLTGWPAVPIIVMLVATRVATALVMSLPVSWLVNHVIAADAIRAIFGIEHLGYWRVVGLFALCFAATFKIKFHGPSK